MGPLRTMGVQYYVKIGGGDYDHTEQRLQALLAEP